MKMIEHLKLTSKEAIYEVYFRLFEEPKMYEKITGKKMIEEIVKFYNNPENIIELCTEKELKYLERVINKEDDLYDDKYSWEHLELMQKMILNDSDEEPGIYEDIEASAKEALKIADWKKVKENDRINEIILGFLKISGNYTVPAFLTMTSFLLRMSQEELEDWIHNNKLVRYYTFYTNKYFDSIQMDLDIINYTEYMDIIDELDLQRSKKAITIGQPLELKEYKEIFYTGFSSKKASVRKLSEKLNEIGVFNFFYKKEILRSALLNDDRKKLKKFIERFTIESKEYSKELISLLDSAMDDMPSGALNGATPKENKEEKAEKIIMDYKQKNEYKIQKNAHLSKDDTELFYKLYFGILEFTNRKYQIIPGLKIYKPKKIDPTVLVDVIEAFWDKKDSILFEFSLANPFNFSKEEMDMVKNFRKGIRNMFIIAKYDEDYTELLSMDGLYMVKGLTCNIDEIISNEQLPIVVQTSIIPFKDQIVFDSVLTEGQISIGTNIKSKIFEDIKTTKKIYKLD